MASTANTKAVENFFAELQKIQATGASTAELSYYSPLSNLLNSVGAGFEPKVFCVTEPAGQGAGRPDFGLYTSRQVQKKKPVDGQKPELGVVEVKAATEDINRIADSEQVNLYWQHYRLVLVTNIRQFILIGSDSSGNKVLLEQFTIAESAQEFDLLLETPRALAREVGISLTEYINRVFSQTSALADPKDVARLLASYARDGLARVESASESAPLLELRSALEIALGVRFEGRQGTHFFHSTLIQTLFYGICSAWMLWAHKSRKSKDLLAQSSQFNSGPFRWRESEWHLQTPVLRALFHQISDPDRLQNLGLVEVLDWTTAALDRVEKSLFFSKFKEGDAVPYFYEPFLEAFDPKLRKQMGVWYTPKEVVQYMVARVDNALKDDLKIPLGLAADNVYVLDPCCGTGAFLAEVLRRIEANLTKKAQGAIAGEKIKQAAVSRLFGFEIIPAPFVVAHMQMELTLQELGASFNDGDSEGAQIYLTNALTGWGAENGEKIWFPELAAERNRAKKVKQDIPILVVLGNPPYNAYAELAVEEERDLTNAYRTVKRVKRPEGKGLNDLYVRFFRMAERRITESTGHGVVCFISNYSWLDGMSFTGMREHFLEEFDSIRIDCLNGDMRKGGKTPEGEPDPSIFLTEFSAGIQTGTAVSTLIRTVEHSPVKSIDFRHLWGNTKRRELQKTAELKPRTIYKKVRPDPNFGLPFLDLKFNKSWFQWPELHDLFPHSYSGVTTSRDSFLVDIDLDRLKARIEEYFDPAVSYEEISRRYPSAARKLGEFSGQCVREMLIRRGGPDLDGFIPFAYLPFDCRWLYWEGNSNLLARPRKPYKSQVFQGNFSLVTQPKPRREWSPPQIISQMGCIALMDPNVRCFPLMILNGDIGNNGEPKAPEYNLSQQAERYLDNLGVDAGELFFYVLAVMHDPVYQQENSDALRTGLPRIPLPDWPDGKSKNLAEKFTRTAERGRDLADLLNTDTSVPDVTDEPDVQLACIALPSTVDGASMHGDDFLVSAGWGRFGANQTIVPGKGNAVSRQYTMDERDALGQSVDVLGETTFDIYLNTQAYLRNIPQAVWDFKLGGYQVLKKWLSYRDQAVLGRAISADEVQHLYEAARRIAKILLLTRKETSCTNSLKLPPPHRAAMNRGIDFPHAYFS